MLEELLKYDRFASKDELTFLLCSALPISHKQKISTLKKYCSSNHYSIGHCFDGTLKLLEFMSLITRLGDVVVINGVSVDNHETSFNRNDFVATLFNAIKREKPITSFISPDAVKRDSQTGNYYIRDNYIPLKFFVIRNLLISLGFFERLRPLQFEKLFITSSFTSFFESQILPIIQAENHIQKRRLPFSALEKKLIAQAELGIEAEEFVLRYEQRRLIGHPNLSGIKIISEICVNAGYDIESFENSESVFLDKYIEVKSYSESMSFHWSKNEIDTANDLGDKYHLYLVDRNKIYVPGYVPKIISNPYQNVFMSEFWIKDPDSWVINSSS